MSCRASPIGQAFVKVLEEAFLSPHFVICLMEEGGHCLSVCRAPCPFPGFTEHILGHDIEFRSSWLKHHASRKHRKEQTRTPMPRSWRLCRSVPKFCDQARPSGKVNFEKPSLGMTEGSKTTNVWLLKVWEAGTTEGRVLERAKSSEARQEETKIYW